MAVKSNSQPAPQRQVVLTFATPSVADILFYETVDGQRIGTAVPDYGTPHPDSRRWPNHKLVFIQNDDEVGQMLRYYYAADRDAQDAYNYELTDGLSLTRTYVIPRADYSPVVPVPGVTPAPSALPVPEGGAPDAVFTTYGFVSDNIVDLGQPLNGLYIAVQRKYEPITRTEIQYDQTLEENIVTTTTIKRFNYQLVTTGPAEGLQISGPGVVYEVKYVNSYHTLLIKAATVTNFVTTTYKTLDPIYSRTMYKMPNILTSFTVYSAVATAFSTDPPDYSEAMDFMGVPVVTETSDGPYQIETRRYITKNPQTVTDLFASSPPRIPTPSEDGTVAVVGAKWWYVPERGVETVAMAREFQLPRALQGSTTVSSPGLPAGFSLFRSPGGGASTLSGQYLIEVSTKEINLNLYEVSASILTYS